ncbi:MAG: hydrolase [Anaerolineae bacterium]|nr:hydrolase [Anaerolineae bacterium]
MQSLHVALIQLAYNGSREAMMAQYRDLVAQAAERGAQLVCLPEFSLTPYFPSSTDSSGFAWAEPLHGGGADQFFGGLAAQYHINIISNIFEQDEAGHFDTAVVHDRNGQIIGSTRKVHLPYGEGYHEPHFFEAGSSFPVHDLGDIKLAAPTCYDQWFPEMARISAMNGAEFIYYPTAIGSEPTDPQIDTAESWKTVMRGHAIANGVFIAAANRVGIEPPVTFYGSSFICDPTGTILAQAGRDSTEVIDAVLQPQILEHWRELFPLLKQRVPVHYSRLLEPYEGTS